MSLPVEQSSSLISKRRSRAAMGVWTAFLIESTLLVLLFWNPVWLVPPHTRFTLYLYPVLLLGWLILLAAALMSILRGRFSRITGIGVACILFLPLLMWSGPHIGDIWGTFAISHCTGETASDGSVRYSCTAYSSGVFVIDSPRGLPVMWLADQY
jgi:hypothetical protein